MNDDDKRIIRGFAAGRQDYRHKATVAFHDALKRNEPIDGPFMLFMSEIDNVTPDLYLRAKYRDEVKRTHIKGASK